MNARTNMPVRIAPVPALGADEWWKPPADADASPGGWYSFSSGIVKLAFYGGAAYAIISMLSDLDPVAAWKRKRSKAQENWLLAQEEMYAAEHASLAAAQSHLRYKELRPTWMEWMGIREPRDAPKRSTRAYGGGVLGGEGGMSKANKERVDMFKECYETARLAHGDRPAGKRARGQEKWKKAFNACAASKNLDVKYGSDSFMALARAGGVE